MCQILCTFEGTDRLRAHLESTFALLCKLQAFSRKISTYASIDYIFRLKTCNFAKFVVPLQRNEEVDITYRLLGVAGDGCCADADDGCATGARESLYAGEWDDIGGFGGLYYAALLPSG